MTDSRAAVGLDRLPWLADEPRPRARGADRDVLAWAAAATLLVAGASYWLGLNSGQAGLGPELPLARETTVALPQPRVVEAPARPAVEAPPQPPVEAPPQPVVEPAAAPPSPSIKAPAARPLRTKAKAKQKSVSSRRSSKARTISASAKSRTKGGTAKADPLRPWPVRVQEGASGRLVRIGTFRTAREAKKGWWAMMRVNPALKRLPALVVPATSLRDGRTYYRLQMGTTSHAHSHVLCQRMRSIGQSCVVIDERRFGTPAA